MGNSDSKPIPIVLDGWSLLESEVNFWGHHNYIFYDKVGEENLNILIDPRKAGNYRVTVSSSNDNYLVKTTMTGGIDMIKQFLQKRYGKACPSDQMEQIPLDV